MFAKWTNLKRLIAVLKDGQWHSSNELAFRVSLQYRHTLTEARKKGYPIEKRKIAHNQYEYRMLAA